jgi:hypothetical protein
MVEVLAPAARDSLYTRDMKHVELIELIAGAALIVGYETTNTTRMGNQEQKRLAAIQQQEQQSAQLDESDVNLWNAQQHVLDRGTNLPASISVLVRSRTGIPKSDGHESWLGREARLRIVV